MFCNAAVYIFFCELAAIGGVFTVFWGKGVRQFFLSKHPGVPLFCALDIYSSILARVFFPSKFATTQRITENNNCVNTLRLPNPPMAD